jgi:3-oxoacyl-[acyl-carrier-protein] synthase-3
MAAKILKIKSYLPDNILNNESLANEFGRWDSDKIEAKLGIRERRVADNNQTAGDLALNVAELALLDYDRSKIDFLILCTQSPDYFLPTTACILQDKLGLRTTIGAYDFNLGCSGYIYGLAMAKSFINAGLASNVLLLTAETYTKHIHPKDLANKTIFGDGATATIIEKSEKEHIFEFDLGTNGKGKNNLIVHNGGFRHPFVTDAELKYTDSEDIYTDNHLYMNGPEIFNFSIEAVPITVENCLAKNKITMEEIDYVIFHQANKYMIEYLRKKIKIPKEKFHSNMLLTGNTVSSTIPIALEQSQTDGIISKGSRVLLCGFGVGYSWGTTIIEL